MCEVLFVGLQHFLVRADARQGRLQMSGRARLHFAARGRTRGGSGRGARRSLGKHTGTALDDPPADGRLTPPSLEILTDTIYRQMHALLGAKLKQENI